MYFMVLVFFENFYPFRYQEMQIMQKEYEKYQIENKKKRHILLIETIFFEEFESMEKCHSKKLTTMIKEVICEKT